MGFGTNQNSVQQPPPEKPKENNDDPFGILGLNMGGGSTANTGQNVVNNQQNLGGMGGLDLLGGFGN